MNRLSPQQRDLILIILLLLIFLAAFPLLGSLFAERVAATPNPTPTEQSMLSAIVTFSPPLHLNYSNIKPN